MEIEHLDELRQLARRYGLEDSLCLVGSAALAVRGFRQNRDLDFILPTVQRRQLLDALPQEVQVSPAGTIYLSDDVQCIMNKYVTIGVSEDDIFQRELYDVHGGFRFVRLELELCQKIIRGKEKDRQDLAAIGYGLEKLPDFDWRLFRQLLQNAEAYRRQSLESRERFGHKVLRGLRHPGLVVAYLRDRAAQRRKPPAQAAPRQASPGEAPPDGGRQLYSAILWGPAAAWREEISADIAGEYPVVATETLRLARQDYRELVKQVYAFDGVEPWKVLLKLSILENYPPEICLISFEIPAPHFRPNQRTGGWLTSESAALKKALRGKYKARIPDYYNDVIIHIGDNPKHNEHMRKTVERHKN